MNDKIYILMNHQLFKMHPQYGGSFKLPNDDINYLHVDKSIFTSIIHDYTLELWFKINHFLILY